VDLLLVCEKLLFHFEKEPGAIGLTASTAVAAAAIGGVTFHSFFGLGGSGGIGSVHRPAVQMRRLKVLIIDEVVISYPASYLYDCLPY